VSAVLASPTLGIGDDGVDIDPVRALQRKLYRAAKSDPGRRFHALTIYACGLRASEARLLSVDDVDIDAGVLQIRDAKGGKDRQVPVSEPLRQRLADYHAQVVGRTGGEWLIPGTAGAQLTLGNLDKNLLGVAVSKEVVDGHVGITQVRGHVPRALGDPRPVGVGRDAREEDPTRVPGARARGARRGTGTTTDGRSDGRAGARRQRTVVGFVEGENSLLIDPIEFSDPTGRRAHFMVRGGLPRAGETDLTVRRRQPCVSSSHIEYAADHAPEQGDATSARRDRRSRSGCRRRWRTRNRWL